MYGLQEHDPTKEVSRLNRAIAGSIASVAISASVLVVSSGTTLNGSCEDFVDNARAGNHIFCGSDDSFAIEITPVTATSSAVLIASGFLGSTLSSRRRSIDVSYEDRVSPPKLHVL